MLAVSREFVADTNIILRLAVPAHPQDLDVNNAMTALRGRGEMPCLHAQNIVEFRSVATRPASVNGLGVTEALADAKIATLKTLFQVLPDDPSILAEWERLIRVAGAAAKQNHDARIAAAMLVHGIPKILTFNKSDFVR